jgi:hypothetical protein
VRERARDDVGPLRLRRPLVGIELQDVEDLDASGITCPEVGLVLLREVRLELSLSLRVLSISAASAELDSSGIFDDPPVVLSPVVEAGALGWTWHRLIIRLMAPSVVCWRPKGSQISKRPRSASRRKDFTEAAASTPCAWASSAASFSGSIVSSVTSDRLGRMSSRTIRSPFCRVGGEGGAGVLSLKQARLRFDLAGVHDF